jgi:hypothetical protein
MPLELKNIGTVSNVKEMTGLVMDNVDSYADHVQADILKHGKDKVFTAHLTQALDEQIKGLAHIMATSTFEEPFDREAGVELAARFMNTLSEVAVLLEVLERDKKEQAPKEDKPVRGHQHKTPDEKKPVAKKSSLLDGSQSLN